MQIDELMDLLDIESEEDFRYFEQFAALMELSQEIDFDCFEELLLAPDTEALLEMTESFFEDLVRGVPDDNTDLYSAVQDIREAMTTLAGSSHHRSRSFFTDELFRFRQWYQQPELITCKPEVYGDGGADEAGKAATKKLSPCEALMLYREEKLSGTKYTYEFESCMPEPVDEYTLDMMAEILEASYDYARDDRQEDDDEDFELPVELPKDFDPETYDPDSDADLLGPIDPYRDGFVDRYNPVIEGIGIDADDNGIEY